MILLPDRLSGAIAALENGQEVDWQKLATLQALDVARLGRQCVEEAIREHEAADRTLAELLGGVN